MANAGPPADRGGVHKSHGSLGANTTKPPHRWCS